MGTTVPNETIARYIKWQSISQIICGLIFWIWAIVNTTKGGFDLGVLSFFSAILAGIFGLVSLNPKDDEKAKSFGRIQMILTPFAHTFVFLNYYLAAIIFRPKNVYYWVAGFLWLLTGIIYTRNARIWRKRLVEFGSNYQSF